MKVPVLLITYKRLGALKEVLKSISQYEPDKIYIFSDGPRSAEEFYSIDSVRKYLLTSIQWQCQIHTNFQDKNLGCKYGPQTAISWFFEAEDRGIILEDDTVPNNSFYDFVEEMLTKYEFDFRIWNISGTNRYSRKINNTEYSYYMSHFAYTWGWATWASRWKLHLSKMATFIEDSENVQSTEFNKTTIDCWINLAIKSYKDQLDAWDYMWSLRIFLENGLSIVPSTNLIEYIGYDLDATHTLNKFGPKYFTGQLEFPLNHPNYLKLDTYRDRKLFEEVFGWKPFYKKIYPNHLKAFILARFEPVLKQIIPKVKFN